MFPYSALFGTTVDTCCVSLRSLFGNRDRYAQCKLCLDQPVEIPQVQFLVRLLTRSLLCCDSCLGLDSAANCGGSAVAVGAVLGGY